MRKKLFTLTATLTLCLSLFAVTYMRVKHNDGQIFKVEVSNVNEVDFIEEEAFSSDTILVPLPVDSIADIQPNDTTFVNYEYVDLGLPSGTLWATFNVGATKPEEYGDYFAWGETTSKDKYLVSTNKWEIESSNGDISSLTKYNFGSDYLGAIDSLSTLLLEDDAATFNWGINWKTPTKDECKELVLNCRCSWEKLNGIKGMKFTADNGNWIFLPAAGRKGNDIVDINYHGYYWTSSLCETDESCSFCLNFYSQGVNNVNSGIGRSAGLSIRPVYIKKAFEISKDTINVPSDTLNVLFPEDTATVDSTIIDESATIVKFNVLSDSSVEVIPDISYRELESITIPSKVRIENKIYTVTSIGDTAFYYCKKLKNIDIPTSVTNIGLGAFFRCESLMSIEIPSNVTDIGYEAFYYCSSLKSLSIPSSVLNIGKKAFIYAGLERIDVMTDNQKYSSVDGIVYDKNRTKILFIPGGINGNVTIPLGITEIEKEAFALFSGKAIINIPSSVTNIGEYAFYECENFDIIVDNSENNVTIGKDAFLGCKSVTYLNSDTSNVDTSNVKYEYVDLGLPSGTLWATFNVGATKPEGYGNYFAWGETKPKNVYDITTYKWVTINDKGELDSLLKYNTGHNKYLGNIDNLSTLLPEDDAATANWGTDWRMPTVDEFEELLDKCKWTWTEINGVKGRKVSGGNGNWIFIPAAGICEVIPDDVGSIGVCWTSQLYTDERFAVYLYFHEDSVEWCKGSGLDRVYGLPIRPVYVKKKTN